MQAPVERKGQNPTKTRPRYRPPHTSRGSLQALSAGDAREVIVRNLPVDAYVCMLGRATAPNLVLSPDAGNMLVCFTRSHEFDSVQLQSRRSVWNIANVQKGAVGTSAGPMDSLC